MRITFLLICLFFSCSTKPIVIGFEGSSNVIVKKEDMNIQNALRLSDSLHRVEIYKLIHAWQNEVDSLQRVIDDREDRLADFEKQKSY